MPPGKVETAVQKTEVRIVAGDLRGRKVTCVVHPGLRPTPQAVREAFFSILGNAIPGRPFVDLFAGTGVIGLEAISRGASHTLFIERDVRLAATVEDYMDRFGVTGRGQVLRSDAYRWAERWVLPTDEPVNVYVSPPFPDLKSRPDEFAGMVAQLQERLPPESIIVVQSELPFTEDGLPRPDTWERRKYGRNLLLIWEKLPPDTDEATGEE